MSADPRGALLLAALGFLQLVDARGHQRSLATLHRWLDSWAGIGLVATGMHRQSSAGNISIPPSAPPTPT